MKKITLCNLSWCLKRCLRTPKFLSQEKMASIRQRWPAIRLYKSRALPRNETWTNGAVDVFSLYIYYIFFRRFFFANLETTHIPSARQGAPPVRQGCLDEIQIEKSKRSDIKIRDRLVLFRGYFCLSQGEKTESAGCHGRIKCVVVRYDDGLEDDLDVGDEFTLTKPQDQWDQWTRQKTQYSLLTLFWFAFCFLIYFWFEW